MADDYEKYLESDPEVDQHTEENFTLQEHQSALVWDPEEGFTLLLPDAPNPDAPVPDGHLVLASFFRNLRDPEWIRESVDKAFPETAEKKAVWSPNAHEDSKDRDNG